MAKKIRPAVHRRVVSCELDRAHCCAVNGCSSVSSGSPDLAVGGRVNLENLNDRSRLYGQAGEDGRSLRHSSASEMAGHLQPLVGGVRSTSPVAKDIINCLRRCRHG